MRALFQEAASDFWDSVFELESYGCDVAAWHGGS
jgi:hypothetical protein